jgi:hypothetical protein
MLTTETQLVLVVILAITGSLTLVQSKSVVPLKKEVWNELNCNKPQSRLAYLGIHSKYLFIYFQSIAINQKLQSKINRG